MAAELLLLRSAPTLRLNQNLRVDRTAGVIRDVVAMQAGVEATGHGIQADAATLQEMVKLGNGRKLGIRSRFGHPGMSENAAGKQLAVAKNFRVRADKLIHDLHFLESARLSPVFARDPLEYVYDIAERHPSEIAESVVIQAESVWTMADGTEWPANGPFPENIEVERQPDGSKRPKDALTPLPVIRPKRFTYVDLVTEGALTHSGLFSADAVELMFSGTANAYAAEVFELVDRWRAEYGIPLAELPAKVEQVMNRYLYARKGKEDGMAKRRQFEPDELPEVEEAFEGESDDQGENELSLDEALQTAEETAQFQQEATENALSARVAQLEGVVAAQAEQIEKLISLSVRNTENIQTLGRNITRLNAEPFVQMSVPRVAAPQLETLQMSTEGAAPQHISERPANGHRPSDDEALASLQASMARRQRTNGR